LPYKAPSHRLNACFNSQAGLYQAAEAVHVHLAALQRQRDEGPSICARPEDIRIFEMQAAKQAMGPDEKVSIVTIASENAKKYHAMSADERQVRAPTCHSSFSDAGDAGIGGRAGGAQAEVCGRVP
jgi:hypothetical protein